MGNQTKMNDDTKVCNLLPQEEKTHRDTGEHLLSSKKPKKSKQQKNNSSLKEFTITVQPKMIVA